MGGRARPKGQTDRNPETVREYGDVAEEACRTAIKMHFTSLMTIASIQLWELVERLHKLKGRIAFH